MTWSILWSIFTKVIDICVVWLVFYYILKNIKNFAEIEEISVSLSGDFFLTI